MSAEPLARSIARWWIAKHQPRLLTRPREVAKAMQALYAQEAAKQQQEAAKQQAKDDA